MGYGVLFRFRAGPLDVLCVWARHYGPVGVLLVSARGERLKFKAVLHKAFVFFSNFEFAIMASEE